MELALRQTFFAFWEELDILKYKIDHIIWVFFDNSSVFSYNHNWNFAMEACLCDCLWKDYTASVKKIKIISL